MLQPDGKLVIGGVTSDENDDEAFTVVRLNGTDGSLDLSFGAGGMVRSQLGTGANPGSTVHALALQPDGRIVAGGAVQEKLLVARLNGADGSFDSSFGAGGQVQTAVGGGPNPFGQIGALAIQRNGRIVAAGITTDVNGSDEFLATRLNGGDGSVDPSFGTGGQVITQFAPSPTSTDINRGAIALQPDGKILLGGSASIGGALQAFVARLIGDFPPSAAFSVTTRRPLSGLPVAFDGNASSDTDGAIGTHSWDFGDGSTGTGATPGHTYRTRGSYEVALTVTDDDGLSATTTRTLTVEASARLSRLRVTPRAFRAANRGGSIARRRKPGARISYRDAAAARTTFTVLKPKAGVRRGRRCVKPPRTGKGRRRRCSLAVGRFVHRDRAGRNRFRFSGRVRGRKLAPGAYRLKATPRFGGHVGRGAKARFRILR